MLGFIISPLTDFITPTVSRAEIVAGGNNVRRRSDTTVAKGGFGRRQEEWRAGHNGRALSFPAASFALTPSPSHLSGVRLLDRELGHSQPIA
jgi:hypothetical protein